MELLQYDPITFQLHLSIWKPAEVVTEGTIYFQSGVQQRGFFPPSISLSPFHQINVSKKHFEFEKIWKQNVVFILQKNARSCEVHFEV